jgi:hypothetical protein
MMEAEKFLEEHGLDVTKMDGWSYSIPVEDYIKKISSEREVRLKFIDRFGFAIISELAVQTIAKYAPLVEVGCGSGYWSYELRKVGVDVMPTDPGTGKYRGSSKCEPVTWDKPWSEIERLNGVQAVEKYSERNLLTVWPDYDTEWPVETLWKFTGQTCLYVGEGPYGCTADEDFHDLLADKFERIEEIALPRFDGIHDSLEVWRRK